MAENKISKQTVIKMVTVNGRTDSAGNINTGLNTATDIPLGVSSPNGYATQFANSGGVYYVKLLNNNASPSAIVNTDVTLYVSYV